MIRSVTYETKVWENDWRNILIGDYLDRAIAKCNHQFTKKNLIINNVNDKSLVEEYAKIKVEEGFIDSYYFSDDYANEALKFFDIDVNSFRGGYHYSIAELVGIYLCETEYLLHFSSDSYIDKNSDWIDDAIDIMSNNTNILTANPSWIKEFITDDVRNNWDWIGENDKFFITRGFSDQCYLIKVNIVKDKIYNERNPASERYPAYGGELFEKRVDAFMMNHNYLRISSKVSNYITKNFPRPDEFTP